MDIRRGDIFYIGDGRMETTGCEMQPGRPAIIVSNNTGNYYARTVEIVYLTSQPKKDMPTHVPIRCKVDSTALCESVYTVATERIREFVRRCTDEEMQMIDKALMVSLGISLDDDKKSPTEPKLTEEAEQKELFKATVERDFYKHMYESLLNKILA